MLAPLNAVRSEAAAAMTAAVVSWRSGHELSTRPRAAKLSIVITPVPLPTTDRTDLSLPDRELIDTLAAGVVTVLGGSDALTPLQEVMIVALFASMTGFEVTVSQPVIGADRVAQALALRNEAFRTRILQVMVLCALVVRPLAPDIVDRLDEMASALSVGEGMLSVARDFASDALGLAAIDFDRNGYTAASSTDDGVATHESGAADAWALVEHDPELAERWLRLEAMPPGSLGRRITEFYRARGFEYPGRPGSAPPLLAQHDWVHVLADYGTKVESELEVFAFIARANDDPRGFGLLAMVVSLFETGYLGAGAGLFEAFPGQLSRDGVAVRLADAMRRGALVRGSVDFMRTDWFAIADRSIDELRDEFGVVPKSREAIEAGSVGPWEPGGISPFQQEAGRARAQRLGVGYDPFGASVD